MITRVSGNSKFLQLLFFFSKYSSPVCILKSKYLLFRFAWPFSPGGQKSAFKTGLQDGYEDLKTLTNPSFWRRISKALATSILDVLQPKFNTPFNISIQVVLKTITVGS